MSDHPRGRPETILIQKCAPAERSWWTEDYKDRAAFTRQVTIETDRMQGGKFGRGVYFDKAGDT